MPITTYMPYEPNAGQWVAIQLLSVFFDSADNQVFVLHGYAGTGKTSPGFGYFNKLMAEIMEIQFGHEFFMTKFLNTIKNTILKNLFNGWLCYNILLNDDWFYYKIL